LQLPPLEKRVVAVPMWPVDGGGEHDYVEFQKATAELELWENGALRERQAENVAPPTMTASQRASRAVHNPVANPMMRRIARPQELRSEYVLCPYSWKF
jgi:hypothetical protein